MTVPQPPGEAKRALVAKLVAGLISEFPGGGFAAAGFQHYMEAPQRRAEDDWKRLITDVVNKLWDMYHTMPDDEVLLAALVRAAKAALATDQQEKRDVLWNAVFNSIAPDAPNADERARFFRLVDEFAGSHLRLLKRFDDHSGSDTQTNERQRINASGTWGWPLDAVVPEFANSREFRDLCIDDLFRARLIVGPPSTPRLPVELDDEYFFGHTTDLGKRFLRFITERG